MVVVEPSDEHERQWNSPGAGKEVRGGTVEAEAVPSEVTRRLVRGAIEQHLDQHEVGVMKVAERSEAAFIGAIADAVALHGVENVAGRVS